jgi:aromatic-amino-acid transaminase
MTLLAKRSIIKEDKSNIITLGAIAKEEKKKDPEVVNATIGMLYDEDEKLFAYKSVDKALSMLTTDEKYAYGSTPGSKDFHEAVKKWVFRQYYNEFKDISAVMATPGGTGALSNTFANYLDENDKALLPNYMWGNYKQVLYENHQDFMTYNLFNENGGFNIEDLKKCMLELKKTQGRILVVINDPCHNPTGYSMTEDEWNKVIDLINEISSDSTPVILLHDMAYIDYSKEGFDFTRKNISLYKKLNDNAMAIMAFSGSKTLALYGIRLGAQVAVSNNKDNLNDFNKANKFSSRSKWSNSTNLGMNLVTKVFSDDNLRKSFETELEESRETLIKRANAFLDESKKCGLKTLPFDCGFFVTIPCNNPEAAYEYLVKKKIHIIPMGKVLRVTISAIPLKDCIRLPKLIKEAIDATK